MFRFAINVDYHMCDRESTCNLNGSFLAVSKPILRVKISVDTNYMYSLKSAIRDLQDLHTFAPLRSQNVFFYRQHLFAKEKWISKRPPSSGGRLPEALFMVFLLDFKGAKACK